MRERVCCRSVFDDADLRRELLPGSRLFIGLVL
jgi:hypothetical protein